VVMPVVMPMVMLMRLGIQPLPDLVALAGRIEWP